MKTVGRVSLLFLLFNTTAYAVDSSHELIRALGPQGVNQWKLQQLQKRPTIPVQNSQQTPLTTKVDDEDEQYSEFPAQWFTQPLDHFDESNGHTFKQRYWVSTRHYIPGSGGPVIVLDGGETSGANRLPFLDTGIVDILTSATGGVGVILEHRYYGKSLAVQNLTTDSLRWLTNEQSAADSANFMKNVKFNGIDEDLTAPGTPWIYYGGSYAGARAAHMRVLYPELTYGAIASSAVTHATLSNWEYMDIIRQAAPQNCSEILVNSIKSVDDILTMRGPGSGFLKRQLKRLFGLGDLGHDEDFASVLEIPMGQWQAQCWDPRYGSDGFQNFCDHLNKRSFMDEGRSFQEVQEAMALPYGHPNRSFELAANPEDGSSVALDWTLLNYASYIKENIASRCPESMTHEECFGTFDDEQYRDTDISQHWRLWLFQVCTQWGYFTTAPPDAESPRIVSKLLTIGYESKICHQAFPPGEHFQVPHLPNVHEVNKLGDFDLEADRLAFIDGEVDPWRPDTPHSQYAVDREDTILRPFKLIPNAVHHYDEYGLKDRENEPDEIWKIHDEMVIFVIEWLADWSEYKRKREADTVI